MVPDIWCFWESMCESCEGNDEVRFDVKSGVRIVSAAGRGCKVLVASLAIQGIIPFVFPRIAVLLFAVKDLIFLTFSHKVTRTQRPTHHSGQNL